MLHQHMLFGLSALFSLVPASIAACGRRPSPDADGPDRAFWVLLAVAAAGPAAWAFVQLGGTWRTGLSATLWVSIAACMILFLGLCATTRPAWRLAPLLLPYLTALGVLALATQHAGQPELRGDAPVFWIDLHIAVSVATYALVTLAAVAAAAALVQERALKSKRPTPLSRNLPPLTDSEGLHVRLLGASAVVLGLGIVSGMSVQYFATGAPLAFDHKTLLSIASLAVICGLLAAHAASGMRGRKAARIVLLAYLLLTLAYPGVKVVTDLLKA